MDASRGGVGGGKPGVPPPVKKSKLKKEGNIPNVNIKES
jgi:hypothetical protein